MNSFPLEPPVTPPPMGLQPAGEVRPFPAPDGEPDSPELPPAAEVRIMVRLRSGEVLEAGACAEMPDARSRAQALVDALRDADSWPFVAGKPLDAADVDAIYLLQS